MADDTNTAEREAFKAAHQHLDLVERPDAWGRPVFRASHVEAIWEGWQARASLAASAGSTEINGQLYTALNNLFTHLGMEGCITADHAFVWDAMTALKRIDGGVHLDNLAVPVDPDAHRDDMLAAVQLLEGGEWAEHFAKTPIGMRLEDQITKLHSEVAASAGSEPVAAPPLQHFESPRAKILMRAWQEGWDACRDAEYVGEEAQNDAFNQSSTVNHCVAEDILYTHPSPPEGSAPASPPMDGEIALIEKAVKRAGITSLLNHGAASCVFTEGCCGVSQEHILAYTREIALHCAVALGSPPEGMAGWISVEDRLPEWAARDDTPCFINGKEVPPTLTSETVLVALQGGGVRTDKLTTIEGKSAGWWHTYGERVIAWQKPPAPPLPASEAKEL